MSGVLSKIMPARSRAQAPDVVVDLDDLIAKTVGFRFQGKTYNVRPVDTETFMNVANELGRIRGMIKELADGKPTSEDEIYGAYHRYISILVPDFDLADLRKMQLPQVHGLLNLIVKHATGQPLDFDGQLEKKKMSHPLA